jgi:hypothetical protein
MSERSFAQNARVAHARVLFLLCVAGCADLTAPSTNASVSPGEPARPAAAITAAPAASGAPRTQPAKPDIPRGRTGIERITASHILVSYKGASRAQPGVTRTKDEARQRAEVLLARIQKGEDFGNVARTESDDPTAKQHSGNLGTFDRFSSVKPFSDAAFSLDVNQVSGIVETEYGYHIIKRTG